MQKICSSCKIPKSLDEFTGTQYSCKQCRKDYVIQNREKVRLQRAQFYLDNKERLNAEKKEWRERNTEYLQKARSKYYQDNRDKLNEANKKWGRENKKAVQVIKKKWADANPLYHNNYQKVRKKSDPLFHLSCVLRSALYNVFSRKRYAKGAKTYQLLGADLEAVQRHLIDSAVRNYGKYFPRRKYHIDHIVPCASAKTEPELIALQHYTNLQYLYPKDNLLKGSSVGYYSI